MLKLKAYAITTPSKAECARVSPKYDNLLQTIKQPKGPVIIAKPIPATKALNKKSSNIFYLIRLVNASIRKMLVIMFMLIKSKSGVNIFSK